jgi:hypothetical protein
MLVQQLSPYLREYPNGGEGLIYKKGDKRSGGVIKELQAILRNNITNTVSL